MHQHIAPPFPKPPPTTQPESTQGQGQPFTARLQGVITGKHSSHTQNAHMTPPPPFPSSPNPSSLSNTHTHKLDHPPPSPYLLPPDHPLPQPQTWLWLAWWGCKWPHVYEEQTQRGGGGGSGGGGGGGIPPIGTEERRNSHPQCRQCIRRHCYVSG